ncbi:hypothetical protein RNJ44_03088 [Nakaseomyces bracarensis]|uniref:DUF2423 domain-containing protein n=1 Tax=Nakaseomyces bracarensis TaxID=273131 RepID=A0ABR4NYS9_9SACH
MAKSLRASTHIHAKSVKRQAVFQKIVDAREARIADKLKSELIQQKLKELREKEGADAMIDEEKLIAEIEEKKNNSDNNEVKVSTSGWREGRHHLYKKNKKLKKSKKKGSFTKF